jgi:hypothetical protein
MTCALPAQAGGNKNASTDPTLQQLLNGQPTLFFFDAVMRAEHNQELVCTEHPVQVGPAIVDHAYLRPARVVLEVGMSDAMDVYQHGQYTSNASKSISAYQTFKQIQAARVPITLATRLDSYQNMVLEDVRASDDLRTSHALRGTLYFRQIISAQISTATVSARPDQTGATNEGTKAPVAVDPASQLHNNLLNEVPAPQ